MTEDSYLNLQTKIGEIWRKGPVIREVIEVPEFASYIRVHERRRLKVGWRNRIVLPTHTDWRKWTAKAEKQ